ncbi:MAG: sigma-70 family RNA polymerase sigma factor [Solirubrobacteraceae bacterium]
MITARITAEGHKRAQSTYDLGEYYQAHAPRLRVRLARRVNADADTLEDACQIAWTRLAARTDVPLDEHGFAWLTTTAVRESWRQARRRRETPAGGFLPDAHDPRELPEPAGDNADPLEVAIEHEHNEQLRARLAALRPREARYVALHAAGLTYMEIAAAERASVRTVERHILRGRHKLKRPLAPQPIIPRHLAPLPRAS